MKMEKTRSQRVDQEHTFGNLNGQLTDNQSSTDKNEYSEQTSEQ